ncbi:hypothetical protein IB276_11840 [Ensifer sp. ENS04]|uniref:hypothetical protein n=1 Tax=Ensifer sp. ENS04 TaxID=2769281 RepID=UPI00177C74BB|nr:hypothetical protein [Ensifer sp. ENS04]MBD9540145.1 hypothetical protein [Ensifer sp. ENS04]
MNARMHIAGTFADMRRAIDLADQEFATPGAENHRKSLERLGRVLMDSLATIIATDGGDDGYLYDADGIADDIGSGYHDLIEQEEAEDAGPAPTQSTHGTLNHRQQGISR